MKKIIFIIASIFLSFVNSNIKADNPKTADNDTTKQTSTMLDEIVVKAPLVRRDADRIVLNVSANPLSANKNALELLQTAPGVWADDERLSIYGQGRTTVYIDDRKVNMSGNQLTNYLKSVQSSSIATIEIIPKAGAEYSADSSGGIIRINLKRNSIDGTSGSAGMNVTSGKYKQWFNPFLNFGLHSGKWTLSLNGNLNGSPTDRYTSFDESSNRILSQEMNGVSRHNGKAIQGNVMLGLFYEPTEKDKLGLQFDYNPNRSRHISDSETHTYGYGFSQETLGNYKSNERFHNFNVSFNWSRSFDELGSVFKIISNYNYQKSDVLENSLMSWSNVPIDSVYSTDNSNLYNMFVTDLSLRKVFNSKWSLDVGAKYTFNNVSNKSFHNFLYKEEWVSSRAYDYDTSYNENIVALYATTNGKAGRWKFKAGVRGEYFNTKGKGRGDGYFDLFPNAYVVYDITENGTYTVALGYYRNIRRPSFQALNPTARQVSDYYYAVGNPNLSHSLTDGVSLDFVLAGRFTVATGFSQTDSPIRQAFTHNPDYPERMYLTWENEGKDRNFFIHGDGVLNITNWWTLYKCHVYIEISETPHL